MSLVVLLLLATWPPLLAACALSAGEGPTRLTVRLALAYYLLAVALMPHLSAQGWRACTPPGKLARLAWAVGWLTFAAHVAFAFHQFHGWSHAAAVEHVRARSGVGEGVYFSYLFTLAWGADAAWWWLAPLRYSARPAWVGWAVHGYLAFMTFNATVVYEAGAVRWGGVGLFAALAGSLVLARHRVFTPGGPVVSSRTLPLLALLMLPALAPAQSATPSADEKKITVTFLQGLQTKEGGFRLAAAAKAPSLRATSSALRALRYFGGGAKDAEGCKKFVLACLDAETGGFADTPKGKPDVVLTAVGLMALVELKLPTEKVEKPAIAYLAENAKQFEQVRMAAAGLEAVGKSSAKNRDWLADLEKRRNADGTYGKGAGLARDTGSAVAAWLRLGGKVHHPELILKALNAGQRRDGGFGQEKADGSDLETSYRVMRTFMMLKAKPERADDLRKFVASCRNRDGGYGVVPGGPSSVGGTYFAGILYHWLDGKK